MRIAILLIAATASSLGNYLILATALTGVAFCYWRYPAANWRQGMRLVQRMRWFFLSIVIVYFWFTPGQVLFTVEHVSSTWLPTYEGIELGLHRVFVLMLIISMVNLLLQITPADRLLTAVYWWARPLGAVGLDSRKLALRIHLVLVHAPKAHELLDAAKAQVLAQEPEHAAGGRVARLGQMIGAAILDVERRADSQTPELLDLPEAEIPPRRQWLLPLGLIVLAVVLQNATRLIQV